MRTAKQCLLLYIEPTPYILPLVREVKRCSPLECHAVFITANASQQWKDLAFGDAEVLYPAGASFLQRSVGAWRLAMRILGRRYAAAHLAGWGDFVLLLAIFCLKLSGTPFSLESDTQLSSHQRTFKASLKARVYPRLFGWARFLLPGGSRQAAYFRHYGVPEERIRPGYMTVDVKAIQSMSGEGRDAWRARHGIGADAVVFIYVGRLAEHKGIRTLLAAFDKLADTRAQLVLLGDGPLRGEVEARKSERVHVTGQQAYEGVIRWMRSADVLLLPSTFEPWGLVVNEAMACGLPVIATEAVGAAADLISAENGAVVPPNDESALHAAMSSLLQDAGRRQKMGAASREIIAPWTIERQAAVICEAVSAMAGAA